MATKTVSYFLGLPYTRRVRLEIDEAGREYFVAYIEEVDGVEADGADAAEARLHLDGAFKDYLEAMLAWGRPIPEPELWPGAEFGAGVEDESPSPTGDRRWRSKPTAISWEDVDLTSGSAAVEQESGAVYR